jgi:hypothetical protein
MNTELVEISEGRSWPTSGDYVGIHTGTGYLPHVILKHIHHINLLSENIIRRNQLGDLSGRWKNNTKMQLYILDRMESHVTLIQQNLRPWDVLSSNLDVTAGCPDGIIHLCKSIRVKTYKPSIFFCCFEWYRPLSLVSTCEYN